LDLLDREGVRCTYFVEGWSAEVYTDAVQRLARAGHELGCHGWRHEPWSDIGSRGEEAALIERAAAAIRAQGVTLRGFRPPGGGLTLWTAELLRDAGFDYISPAAERLGRIGDLVVVPFRWTAIDAYYFFDAFSGLRKAFGDPPEPLPPERLVAGVDRVVDEVVATGGCVSLLFHPFLQAKPDHFTAMAETISAVARRDDVWCAPCTAHVDWALEHPELLATNPALERLSWR
jgi:peptidoglycan/xylan/chitin deacetylase (PgdA/CDA1 family)